MASAQERFDSKKIRDEIFQTSNRNIFITIMFVAETAIILREKRRKSDFMFIVDRSIEILEGNIMLKKALLSFIVDLNTEPLELLKYYIEFEKLLDDSRHEKEMRIFILLKIGNAYNFSAHYKNAIEYALTAETIAHELKNNSGKVSCCATLGKAYRCLGENKKAIDYYKTCLQISTEIGDRSGIASDNGNLGDAYYSLGEYQKGIDYCKRGLQISTEIGDQSGIATNNGNLGNGYLSLGEYQKAIDYYKRGLQISTEIGDRSGIASSNGNLGNAYRNCAEYKKAISYYERGLAISTEIGDRSEIASNNGKLGNAYLSSGEYQKAIDYYKIGLQISTEIGDRSGIASNNGNLGNVYRNFGEYKKAIDYYNRGLEINTEIGDRSGIAINNGNLGNAYCGLGEYQKAIDYYTRSLEINTEVGGRPAIASSNTNLGNAYTSLGDYQKAIDYHQRGLQISTEIVDRSGIARVNENLGNAYFRFGKYQKAIDYYKKGLEVSTEIGDRSGMASNNGNLGNAYLSCGEYKRAIAYYKKGLEIGTEIGDRSAIASNNGNLGNAYLSLGEYQKAIDYCKRGLEISTEIGDRSGIASNIENLGNSYLRFGDYKKAIDYYNKGLVISIEIGDRSGIASNIGSLGNAFVSLGEYEKAIYYYKRGLEISTENRELSAIALINGNLGNAYCSLGEYQEAIDCYKRGLEISTEIGDPSGIANNNGNLGNVYCRLGQYQKAIDCYKRGVQISTEIGDRSGMEKNNGNLGCCYLVQVYLDVDNEEVMSILQQAAGCLEESVKYSDEIFAGLSIDENKISFTKECYCSYKLLMVCFILLKRIEAALLIIDLGKAKALHAFLEKQNKSECDIMSDYTRNTWERIHNNEENMQTKEIENIIDLTTNNSTVLFFSFDIFKVLNIWVVNGEDDMKFDIRKESKEMRLPEEHIYDNLKKLLKFFSVNLMRDSSFNKPDLDSISCEQMITSQLVRKLVNCETNSKLQRTSCPKNQSGDNTPETPENNLRNLYRVLIEPVKYWIKGTKLIIVPDKFLFFLPFCALLDENGCRLSENYCIEITPSLHTLVSSITRSRDTRLGFALFVGNPTVGKISFGGKNIEPSALPSATEEVKCLAPLFEAQPLVDGEATKERVLRFINGASIIHIAAHGEKERGEIFLSPSRDPTEKSSSLPKEDSYLLKQQDIMDIGINASLVVLSCCHTGKGEISCEGVVGLTRAFLAAGARSVLATLWPIHDEATKEFMNIFYDKICNEISVCEALRATMNMFQTHQNEEFRSLQIWAPFTIYGEDVKFTKGDIEEIKEKSRQFNEKVKSI